MQDDIYKKLNRHLDTFLLAAPEAKSIVEILKIRYTPEEAEVGLLLSQTPAKLSDLVASTGRDKEEFHAMLKHMAGKGIVHPHTVDGEDAYSLFPTAVGLWETSFAKGESTPETEKLARLWRQYYLDGWGEKMVSGGTPYMRVIPVDTSVNPEKEVYSYEKAADLIKEYDYICVLHCPCREAARLEGKGCGKPTETCFHFGELAEFFVKKGFGREITQQEAMDILDMTEKAGLIHTVANSKQMGVAMCSCCTCCCTQYRAATEFGREHVVEQSRFAAKVDTDKCIACRRCEERCMPSAFSLKKTVTDRLVPPCEDACPAGINVPGYVALIGEGREIDAYNLILKNNPFPAVCGRVCTHPCELSCTRNQVDAPVAIRHLKRYITDTVFENYTPEAVEALPKNGKSVGIVGAGPSGLSCGYYLALLGFDVDVYESQPVAGGVLAYGIPEYRVPRSVLAKEIDMIEKAGVKIHLNTDIGKEITFDRLRKDHDALYLAIGTQSSKKAGIPGEDLPGVYDGLNFLREVSLGEKPQIGKTVVVVGGGNVAVDVARSALRLGAASVSILYRREREDMPAFEEDVLEALEDGVKIINSFAPKEILGKEKVTGVEFMRCTQVRDESGAVTLTYDVCDITSIDCDTVITAIGQSPDISFVTGLSDQGRLTTDPATRMTSLDGVFAGGDLVRGSDVAIAAIADGKEAAIAIDVYLGGKGVLNTGIAVDIPAPDLTVRPYLGDRYPLERLDKSERVCSFDEVVKGYCKENAIGEAKRCLRCDQQLREEVDPAKCMGCGLCVTTCPGEAITLVEREAYEAPVTTLEELFVKYLGLE